MLQNGSEAKVCLGWGAAGLAGALSTVARGGIARNELPVEVVAGASVTVSPSAGISGGCAAW